MSTGIITEVIASIINLLTKPFPVDKIKNTSSLEWARNAIESAHISNIASILNDLQGIKKFTIFYSGQPNLTPDMIPKKEEQLKKGMYLNAFVTAIQDFFREYNGEWRRLEKIHLQKGTINMKHIHTKMSSYKQVSDYLCRLILGIHDEHYHGVDLFYYVIVHSQHQDTRVSRSLNQIETLLRVVFLDQISYWMIYGDIVDPDLEFFIYLCKNEGGLTYTLKSFKSHRRCKCFDIDMALYDIDQHRFNKDMIPKFLPIAWCEKVLFIGKITQHFSMINNPKYKCPLHHHPAVTNRKTRKANLWQDREGEFFGEIQSLLDKKEIVAADYNDTIDNVNDYVLRRIEDIAFDHAEFVSHMQTIYDFYLTPKYLKKFVRLTYDIYEDNNTSYLRSYLVAFAKAVYGRVGGYKRIQLAFAPCYQNLTQINEFSFIQYCQINFRIAFPYQLILSSDVIAHYNFIFRHNLMLEKIILELHIIECGNFDVDHISECDDTPILNLRNSLLRFTTELRVYLIEDCIEPQFKLFVDKLKNEHRFDRIHAMHYEFLRAITFFCFFFNLDNENSMQDNFAVNNTPLLIIDEVLEICKRFIKLTNTDQILQVDYMLSCTEIQLRLNDLMTNLLRFAEEGPQPDSLPVHQLIDRLGVNTWFNV